ncbi:MAG: DNA polymerase III subunit delta [Myxococcota bacterium]
MSLSKLRESLSKNVHPVYVLIDDARPLVDQAIASIHEAVLPNLGAPAFNHSRYRASEPNAADAFITAQTLPVMASMRLVEVLGFEEASRNFVEGLLAYLESPSDMTVLVVAGARYPKVEKLNPSIRITKALKAAKLPSPLKFNSPPATFVIERAKAQGKTIDRNSAKALVEAVGKDLGQLEAEVDKLVTYVGEAEAITAEAMAEATSVTAAADNWELTAALAARDVEGTLSTLHRLQNDGVDARPLLGLIAWQMRQLAMVREALLAGKNDRAITEQFRIRRDVYRKVKPYLLDSFPDGAELLRRIATANRQMNSHRAGADRLLEGLVLEMLTGRLRRPPDVPRPR